MRRSNTRWFAALGTSLALGLFGCGGGQPADEGGDGEAAADPAPPAAREAEPPVVAANPDRAANAPAEAAAAAPAARPLGAAANASATDELLALSQAAPAQPAAAAGANPAAPGGEAAAAGEAPGLDAAGANPNPAGYANAGGRFGVGVAGNNDAAEAMLRANAGGFPAPGQENPAAAGGEGAPIPGGYDLGGAGAGGAESKAPSFVDPVKGATSFLAALHAKDPERIAESIALRAPTEAAGKHQSLFQSLLLKSASATDLDELASHFDKMKVVGMNSPKVVGLVGVTVGRQEEDGKTLTVTLEMRKEKAGWKVQDYKQPIQRTPPGRARRPVSKGR